MPSPVGQKGYTGNPGGRAAMPPELRKAVQGYAKEALEYLAQVRADENAKPDHRIKAAEVLIDRGFGKAVQAIDATLTESKPLTYDEPLSAPDNKAT